MISLKLKIRFSLFAGILFWLCYSFFDLYLLFIEKYQMNVSLSRLVPQIFLSGFIASALFYFRFIIAKAESINFIDLLWRVFITGLVTTVISLLIRGFFFVFANSSISENAVTVNLMYHVLVALVVVYLVSTFVVWKRLILYQKSKNLIRFWTFFEYALFLSLIFDLFGNKFLTVNFNAVLFFLSAFAIILSLNLKWIAYLNFRQKWKTILFISLSGIYVYHFLFNLINFSATDVLHIDLLDRVFIIAMFIFIFLYAGISVLVTIFNLPTSSVFERKLQEAIDFQKLSQSIPSGQSAEQTYDILIESSMSAVFADAAWLEIQSEDPFLVTRGIKSTQVDAIKESIKQPFIKEITEFRFKGEYSSQKVIGVLTHVEFKSIIALPIMVKGGQKGCIVLLQEVSEAFNKEMVDIITTFVNQASISLENFQLISEALENERYLEELKIAKRVQKSLLPENLVHNKTFAIEAFSQAADEVGGDYYDMIETETGVFRLIIGDVSGKGTSAAFNMAQMKGIFHSLAQNGGTPAHFIRQANAALSKCLEKSSFITATYFEIDTETRKISYVRAGHCPTLHYSNELKEARYLESDGLGLGIIRNSDYDQYVESNDLCYQEGDLLLLYTDGIIEAKNSANMQYGTEGLKSSLLRYKHEAPARIKEGIIKDLHSFLNGTKLDDDYTLVIVKFY